MPRKLRVGVLASGTGSNFRAIVEAAGRGEVDADVVALVTNVATAGAVAIARAHGIPATFVDPKGLPREEHEARMIDVLDGAGVELVCLAGYMRLLTPRFVQHYAGRLVNVHPALLPAFPGLHGQRQAWEHGVRIAGCTTHLVTEEMDAGPILLQAAVPVLEDDTWETLQRRILAAEHVIYPRTIQLFAQGRVRVEGRRARILGAESDPSARLIAPEGTA